MSTTKLIMQVKVGKMGGLAGMVTIDGKEHKTSAKTDTFLMHKMRMILQEEYMYKKIEFTLKRI